MLDSSFSPPVENSHPIHELLALLKSDIKQAVNEEGVMTKGKALEIVGNYLRRLRSMYSKMQKRLQRATPVQVEQIRQEVNMRDYLSIKPGLLELFKQSIFAYTGSIGYLTKKAPFESLYLSLGRLIEDCYFARQYFEECGESFIDTEINILCHLRELVLSPHLDPFFIKVQHFYSYVHLDSGITTAFRMPLMQEDKRLDMAIEQIVDMHQQFKHDLEKTGKYTVRFRQFFLNKLEAIENRIEICSGIFMILETAKQKRTAEDFGQISPILHQVFQCFEDVNDIICDLENLQTELDHAATHPLNIEEKSEGEKQKDKPNQPNKIQASRSEAALSVPSLMWPDGHHQAVIETRDDDSSLDSSDSEDSFENSLTSYAKPLVFTKPKRLETSKYDETENLFLAGLGNTARKVIQKIFDGSLKIKHVDLVTLINNLNGTENKKTGSSSRKLVLSHHKIFLHERHGRDRHQYADPNAIKRVKEMLLALDIGPEAYDQAVQNRIKRKKK